MELLLFLPLLLAGGLVFGGSSGSDDDESADEEKELLDGTSDPDILLGDNGPDLINGLEGNDIIFGGAGADRLNGGPGDDILLGGAGNDVLAGGAGHDLLVGGGGNDVLMGGFGADVLIGSSGSNALYGGEGNDTLMGLEYDLISEELPELADEIRTYVADEFGEDAADQISARITNGVVSGNAADRGPDLLEGGAGDDLLFGDDGDTLTGGAGDDEFVVVYRSGENASIITDFDHQTETLSLVLDDPDDASLLLRADGLTDSVLLVNGQIAVRLIGQTVAELSADPSSWLFLEPA